MDDGVYCLSLIHISSWGIGTLIAVVAYGPIIDRLMVIFEPFSFAVAGMTKEDKKGK